MVSLIVSTSYFVDSNFHTLTLNSYSFTYNLNNHNIMEKHNFLINNVFRNFLLNIRDILKVYFKLHNILNTYVKILIFVERDI